MPEQTSLWPGNEPRVAAPPPGFPTRALTLWQPWAWLVANGHKDIENRPQGFSHKSFRGEFWIHASLKGDTDSFVAARRLALAKGIDIPPLTGDDHFGAIIGRATITAIVPPGDSGHFWHFKDQWGFKVVDARPVKPVRCRGYQGFWGVPPETLIALVANEETNG